MQFGNLCPLWLITALDKESGDVFAKKMERQLMAFSKNEFGSAFDATHERWWRIDNITDGSDLKIDSEGYPADIPIYKKKGDTVNRARLNVVVFGPNQKFDKCIEVVKALKEKKARNEFMIGAAAIARFYGLLSFKKGDVIHSGLIELLKGKKSKKKADDEFISFPFDSLFLQGSCNRVAGNGDDFSYPALVDEKIDKKNDWDLAVQLIFRLALSQGELSLINQKRLNVVGAFTLNYEPEKEKNALAIQLSNAIVAKFSDNDSGEHWFDSDTADISKDFEKSFGWESIYGRLKLGYRNLDTDDLVPRSEISPWRLLLREIIPYYFKKYIRGLVRHVRENLDGFSYVTMRNYESHVNNQLEIISRDEERKTKIENELSSIWEKENIDNVTVGMKQFIERVDKMIEFFKLQKTKTNELANAKTADGKNHFFPKLEDYPLGDFGKYQDSYAKLIRSNPDRTAIGDMDPTGDGLLQRVMRTLSFHPVPLGLLVRSILAGLLLPMVLLVILRLIPDGVFNTGALENAPGCYWLSAGCFLACVCWAVMKYGFGVVGKVRNTLKDYVAWCLFKIQLSAYRLTLDKEEAFYQGCLDICTSIKTNAEAFSSKKVTLKEDETQGFEINMFQANIMKPFEGHPILKSGTLVPVIKTVVNRHGVDYTEKEDILLRQKDGEDELHYGIFRNVIVMDAANGVLEGLKECLFDPSSLTDMENKKQLICRQFAEKVAHNIEFHVGGREIQTLKDIVFDRVGNSNFVTWERDLAMDDMILQRSFPSAEVTMDSLAYESLTYPNDGQPGADSWRDLMHLGDDRQFDIQLSSFGLSIVRGFAIDGLDDIKDIKIS